MQSLSCLPVSEILASWGSRTALFHMDAQDRQDKSKEPHLSPLSCPSSGWRTYASAPIRVYPCLTSVLSMSEILVCCKVWYSVRTPDGECTQMLQAVDTAARKWYTGVQNRNAPLGQNPDGGNTWATV